MRRFLVLGGLLGLGFVVVVVVGVGILEGGRVEGGRGGSLAVGGEGVGFGFGGGREKRWPFRRFCSEAMVCSWGWGMVFFGDLWSGGGVWEVCGTVMRWSLSA